MSIVAPCAKPVHEGGKILGPDGNRAVGVPVKAKKPQQRKPGAEKMQDLLALRNNASIDSSCSSGSSSSSGGKTPPRSGRREKPYVSRMKKPLNSSPETVAPVISAGHTCRCEWITANSDPLYISFHDEEWGVPVDDDDKLFELLCLSIALAEHSWLSILCNRDMLRKLFDDFKLATVANFSEDKLLSITTHSSSLLSEPKLRAIVDNAKQIIEVKKQFGSFSNYCWRFVNNKPMKNGYRYQWQVPVKTPKAELISKDLLRRGFRCVGPTVVYSFMQVAGMVNDHITTCFRYDQCCLNRKNNKVRTEETRVITKGLVYHTTDRL